MPRSMKPLNLLFFFIFICSISCTSQENSEEISITYNALTRGNQLSIIADSNTITKIEDGAEIVINTPKYFWSEISNLIENITLNRMNTFEAPSDKRLYDGALHANLTITKNYISYNSTTFDHGNPPFELKDLIEKILSAN